DEPGCPSDERNLVWRAAAALWREAGRRGAPAGWTVHLRKRIPLQGGLGGGSSDAAATLRGLNALWRLNSSDEELSRIGATLGADGPFFRVGGTALGLERGDVLFPFPDVPRAWLVLVIPAFGVSTAAASSWWDEWMVRRDPARQRTSPLTCPVHLLPF